jgi:hypothetical protein
MNLIEFFKSTSIGLSKVAFILLCLVEFAPLCQAQYNYNLTYIGPTPTCPTPVSRTVRATGLVNMFGSNSACPDSITMVYYWGDGTTDTITSETTGGNYYCYFTSTATHVYFLPGIFRIKTVAIDPVSAYSDRYLSSMHLSSSCVEVSGEVFLDSNQNCTWQSGELPRMNVPILFRDSVGSIIGYGSTDSNGAYLASVSADLINCSATPAGDYAIDSICPGASVFHFNSTNDTTHDFPVHCANGIDLKVQHGFTGVGPANDTGVVSFRSYLRFCESDEIQTELVIDTNLEYQSLIFGPQPDSIVGNHLYWTTQSVDSNENGGYYKFLTARAKFITKPGVANGTPVRFDVLNRSSRVEKNLGNNNLSLYRLVDGPYDPNNKEVDPQGIGPNGNVAPFTEFRYTVNFQNTGTAEAKNIFIIDSISDHLDLSTLKITDSSDPMLTEFHLPNLLRFDFRNINLPDSASDPEGSKGWFSFSIKAKEDLPLGTQISNFVDIYFDYNAPIRTNSTLNTIADITYPEVNVNTTNNVCLNNDIGEVEAIVQNGTAPYKMLWSNGSKELIQSEIVSGMYTFTLTDSNLFMVIDSVEVMDDRSIQPQHGEIEGKSDFEAKKSIAYWVVDNIGSQYDWNVAGGQIITNEGAKVYVQWDDTARLGQLSVTETDGLSCKTETQREIPLYPLAIENLDNPMVSVYPNPSNRVVFIELDELFGDDRVSIYNEQGALIKEQTIKSTRTEIDLKSLPAGVYNVKVYSGDRMSSYPIIKQN